MEQNKDLFDLEIITNIDETLHKQRILFEKIKDGFLFKKLLDTDETLQKQKKLIEKINDRFLFENTLVTQQIIIKMRYSLEPKYRKYVEGYRFLSFARKFGDKYGKKLIDTATKTGIDAAKTTSKRGVQKTAEATGDLIGSKIADKTTSVGKKKETKKR